SSAGAGTAAVFGGAVLFWAERMPIAVPDSTATSATATPAETGFMTRGRSKGQTAPRRRTVLPQHPTAESLAVLAGPARRGSPSERPESLRTAGRWGAPGSE